MVSIKLCPHTCHWKKRGGNSVLTGLYMYKTEGGVIQSHDVYHAKHACNCGNLGWVTLSDVCMLRFGYRLYFAYKNTRKYATYIKEHYMAGWTEFFGPESAPMFNGEYPLDLSDWPPLVSACPVPWPIPPVKDLADPTDPDAPTPTPPELFAKVPAPIERIPTPEAGAVHTETVASSASSSASPTPEPVKDLPNLASPACAQHPLLPIPPIIDHLLTEIDELKEALEVETRARKQRDKELRTLRDDVSAMRSLIEEKFGSEDAMIM
ncbi:hypothetical protein DFP72DRAFT_904940 [Ephemerocybe angulata]|uniref:Uncharacterized protein n=1 Tax=Ephemerocybe angulata TaxID=980116 RepID=A0A8H6HVD0_9AGAR|nr:hypothetical protein DFP72DRAFT_904940 [Tulosesus angulatus]